MNTRRFLKNTLKVLTLFFLAAVLSGTLTAQTTSFTIQWDLDEAGVPANGILDLQFKLFDASTSGNQIGNTLTISNVQTAGRTFRVNLDFGATAFPGADRFLEVSYSPVGEGTFITVETRRFLTGIPYSTRALNAASAELAINAENLGGSPASQFVQTNDPRMSDARVPLPGSSNYIQNSTTPQSSTNFNITGTGTAGVVNATTSFSLRGSRVLAAESATRNLFIGINAGVLNTGTPNNTFVGDSAGQSNAGAGNNSFFGAFAGNVTTTGGNNSFFGFLSGRSNVIGQRNAFFGQSSGLRNTSGNQNTFIGEQSGLDNTTGSSNVFIGHVSGFSNTTGSDNIFIGRGSRLASTTQVNNSVVIGTNVGVTKSNSIVLGNDLHETKIQGRMVVGTPFSTGGPLPGRGYFETFFQTSLFQGIYTPNVLIGSYPNNPRGTVRPCVLFQTIPGLATGVTLTNCVSSFSSLNDKTDVKSFTDGLAIIKRLNPVAFRHKENGMSGIGLNTEDVASVAPSLVDRDAGLSVANVSEGSLIVLLINSIKQQAAQIERLQSQVDVLKTAVCRSNPTTAGCDRE